MPHTLDTMQTYTSTAPDGSTVYSKTNLQDFDFDSAKYGHDDLPPILVLIHGYPQNHLLYKHVIDRLPTNIPLYVPDIPGYGSSTIAPESQKQVYSKREIGRRILDSLSDLTQRIHSGQQQQKQQQHHQKRKIILAGHDRGARITHRLAVDNDHPAFDIIGAIIIEIVPTVVQFQSFQDPKKATATFHWPFLAAEYPLPEEMIGCYGGDKWVEMAILGWAGVGRGEKIKPEEAEMRKDGLERVKEALPVYKEAFKSQDVINASCADYRGAAKIDCAEQEEDQKNGRKLDLPTLVIYSLEDLGKRYDVENVWKEWVKDEKKLSTKGVGNVGHFIPEEDPDATAKAMLEWLQKDLKVTF